MRKRQAKGLGIVLGLLAIAQTAQADVSTLPGPSTLYPNTKQFTVLVTATVGGICGFATAPNDTYTITDIDSTTWSHQTNFVIDCNVASHVAVTSDNGGLLRPVAPGVTGYTNLSPYQVELNLVGASAAVANASCPAASLKTGAASPCSYFGTAVTGNSSIGLGLGQPSQNLTGSYVRTSGVPNPAAPDALVAGTYTDVLRVSIAATP